MRKVLQNHNEVCHFWANKVQSEGRAGNMFFVDDSIWSYGTHFKIAKHYDDKVLFTSRNHSISTSQHKSKVFSSIPHNNIFTVPNVENPESKENIDYYYEVIEENLKKASRARSNKSWLLNTAKKTYEELKRYVKAFNLKTKVKLFTFDDEVLENIKKDLQEKAKLAKKKQAIEKKKVEKELKNAVTKWRENGDNIPYSLRRFLTGDIARIDNDTLYTDRSCKAPLEDVKTLLNAVKNGLEVKGMKTGHYTVNEASRNKIVIGCHKFNKEEIDYISSKLNINLNKAA